MITRDNAIARELLVDAQGHLSELGATLFADGEDDHVPSDLREHAEECDACLGRIGEAALLSEAVGRNLLELPARQRQVRSFPKVAVGAALAIAAAGFDPFHAARWARPSELVHLLTAVAKTGLTLWRQVPSHGPLVAAFTCSLGLAAAAVSFWMVRQLPRVTRFERGVLR